MSTKFKLLGLGFLIALTASAVVAVNTTATAGGHFTSNRDKTTLEVIEQAPDTLEFVALGEGVVCEKSTYHGVVTGKTFTAATLKPKYEDCRTTNSETSDITATTHDCVYEFTVRPNPDTKHNTVHLKCPNGKKLTFKHAVGGCTVEVGPQTVSGVVYKEIQWQGTKSLTAEFTIKDIVYTVHGGFICGVFGTERKDGELKGSVIVKAWNADKPEEGADIQAT